MKIRKIVLFAGKLGMSGCSGFLDEFSQTYIRASKISDYDELLLGSVYMPNSAPVNGNNYCISSGRSCDFFNVLADDINMTCEKEVENTGDAGAFNQRLVTNTKNLFGFSAWQKDVCKTILNNDFNDESTWVDLYKRIAIINTILDEVDRLDINNDEERLTRERVKGECYFLRAQFYLTLVNLYGKPYNPATASTDLGVPLKISSGVEHDKDKDTQFERTTLDKIYRQLADDLTRSVACLKQEDKGVLYRVSEGAAAVLLSRVYLYMQEWEAAREAIKPYLGTELALMNIAGRDFESEGGSFINTDNGELLFSQGNLNAQKMFTGRAPDFCVTRELYDLYEGEDARKSWFSINYFTDSVALSGKYYTGDGEQRVSDYFTVRAAEGYLNMAEACAMTGKDDGLANQYLNALRRNRIGGYVDQTYSGEELVNQIRTERRKELCFEGHRWFDMRRYTVSNPYPYSKEIFRYYYSYQGAGSRYRLDRSFLFRLEKNDAAYTFDIPKTVKEFDVVPMPGNERPDRPEIKIN